MSRPARAALGTMHGKAAAIAPPLARLGITVEVPPGLDTDRFGTFTGEVPRAGTMQQAARAKARAAAAALGLPVGLASEGSYGPHPAVPIVPVGRELLLWHDSRTGHEVAEWHTDTRPCHDQAELRAPAEAAPLLDRVGFPGTAVTVAPADAPARPVAKGVQDRSALDAAVDDAAARSGCGRALLQTDMRAHLNPRRMAVIADLAARFAARLARDCPACGAPGWGHLRAETGLPCAWCGGPTGMVARQVHGCTACGTRQTRARPDGLDRADPGQCPACNP